MGTAIKTPIIVDNRGDLLVFESVAGAETYLEPIDVRNDEYVAYDSEGRLLRLVATSPRVTIRPAEEVPRHAEELHAILFVFLVATGAPADSLKDAPLELLIQKALKYKLG